MKVSNKDKIAVKKLLNVADKINACTRCTEKPIVKNHMCEECEEKLNEWLRPKPKLDDDQWYTLYESGAR